MGSEGQTFLEHLRGTLCLPTALMCGKESICMLPLGAGCRNRTCFVSLKRRVHIHICQSRKLWCATVVSNHAGPD